jgi:uncharacterized protein involved in exopolysaccharide biosynthesis
MKKNIIWIVMTVVLVGLIAGVFALLAPPAPFVQESGAAQIIRATGSSVNVPEASLYYTLSPAEQDAQNMDVPTVDTMSRPDFKWF